MIAAQTVASMSSRFLLSSGSTRGSAKIMHTLQADTSGHEITACAGKEILCHTLYLPARVTDSVPCERSVPDRLFAFYDWCACNADIPKGLNTYQPIAGFTKVVGKKPDLVGYYSGCGNL